MVVIVKYEELLELIESSIDAWMEVGGGPNMDAYDFDPNLVNLADLESKGYYTNRDAWIAGVQIKKLQSYLDSTLIDPVKASQNS